MVLECWWSNLDGKALPVQGVVKLDAQLLGFLLGISVAVIGTLVTALGVSLRRNGRNSHNPNFATLELLLKQQVAATWKVEDKLGEVLLVLTEVKTRVSGCPTVQRHIGG